LPPVTLEPVRRVAAVLGVEPDALLADAENTKGVSDA
jgi:hypothetical protein